jgi:hypothetical protein
MKKAHKSIVALSALLMITSLNSYSAYADKNHDKGKDDKKMVEPISNTKNYCAKTLSKSEEKQFRESGLMKKHDKNVEASDAPSRKSRDVSNIVKKLTAKNNPSATSAANTLTAALATNTSSRGNAINTFNNLEIALKSQCESALSPLKAALASAATTAKGAYNSVNTNAASTPVQKQSAKDAYNASVTLANTTFVNASKVVVNSFQTQMDLAQLNLINAVQQADQLLKNAIATAKLSL